MNLHRQIASGIDNLHDEREASSIGIEYLTAYESDALGSYNLRESHAGILSAIDYAFGLFIARHLPALPYVESVVAFTFENSYAGTSQDYLFQKRTES